MPKVMRILVHICCGPCAITVLRDLSNSAHDLEGFFYNPNVQPLAEHLRRREGAGLVARRFDLPIIYGDELPEDEQHWRDPWQREQAAPLALPAKAPLPPAVDPAPWLLAVAGREEERCAFCLRLRLRMTANLAKARNFDAFTTSLLYSRHQQHDHIRALGEQCAKESGTTFFYRDFRPTWQEGITLSKEWGIYRQPYCGCVFSEYERYASKLARVRHGQR
ncbi:epoxyqueuosine reductase QueH [Desulfovibrio sp. OttesenSCG-928-M14]|nr:epoxyqueuosine reductase QueH [Desulfovibrio sp. OttesenSCG-928-M14]